MTQYHCSSAQLLISFFQSYVKLLSQHPGPEPHSLCDLLLFITGPPNSPVLFCWLASVVVVCNAARCVDGWLARGRAHGRLGSKHCTAGQCGYVPLGGHLVYFCLSAAQYTKILFNDDDYFLFY